MKGRSGKGAVLALVLAGVLVLGALGGFLGWPYVQRAIYPVKYQNIVEKWANEYGLDPYLVYAFIRTESSFDPVAESSAGARGLMQMTEDTFDWLKTRIAEDEALTYEDLYDPNQAVRFGSYFLSISLERYGGDISTAAAAYHSGWGTVDGLLAEQVYSDNMEYLTDFPHRQMGHYVYKINNNYQKYLKIYH